MLEFPPLAHISRSHLTCEMGWPSAASNRLPRIAARFNFRARLDLKVLLPLGSEAGNYEVEISTELGKLLVSATVQAVIRKDGVTALKVKFDISKLAPRSYVPGIGQVGEEENYYPVLVK